MKICSAICEYNPFHNGHLKHIEYIKNVIKPDYLVIILSGNFTQRGEIAVTNKYTRATWAIKAGADAVIELPTVFATATAELFASGAIKLINSINGEKSICFGVENNDLSALTNLANISLNETPEMQEIIKKELDNGQPFIKARNTAIEKLYGNCVDVSLLNSPNNVLALEYIKAIIKNGYDISVNAITRSGGGYNDGEVKASLSSALAIRNAINNGNVEDIKTQVPTYVYNDLPSLLPNLDKEVLYSILTSSLNDIKGVLECAEGLENRIKSLVKESLTVNDLLNLLKTKRYTDARLRRILLATTLKIKGDFVKKCLNSPLYLKVLAINKNKPEVLSVLANSTYPVITRKSDAIKLKGVAKKCFEKDAFACNLYSVATKTKLNENEMKIV